MSTARRGWGVGRAGARDAGAMSTRPHGTRGSVTAETAVVLPALVLVAVLATWLISLVGAKLRCVDAARAAARSAARGEDPAEVAARVRSSVGAGATAEVSDGGESVVVVVRLRNRPPGVLGALLPDVDVMADATARYEPGVGQP